MRHYWWRAFLLFLFACRVSSPAGSSVPPTATLIPANTPTVQQDQPSPTGEQAPTETPSRVATEKPASTPQSKPGGSVAALPQPSDYHWEHVIGGLNRPVGLANAGDGSGRLFIVEQDGLILVWKGSSLLDVPFLDIRDRVGSRGSEQGLLGLAFHPHYAQNGFFYVNYTDTNGDTHISRFSVSKSNPDQADPSSEKRLIFQQQPFPNHNGGSVVFGPDGYLYLGLGDGGSAGDPMGNGQSTQTLLGKILRIDVDSGDPYAIPSNNPFARGGGLPEIWAYGLRNPWRFAFDSLTGDVYIGDVGQDKWEEIDFLPAGSPPGANFGWNYREGRHDYSGAYTGSDLIDPVAEYDHSQGCSVTGGVVYRGVNLQEWQGVYLYGDYCSGMLWGLLHKQDGSWQNALLFQTGFNITSFGVDQAGEVYLVDYSGDVYRLAR